MEIKLTVKNCLDCPNSLIEQDPDPLDSFYFDDVRLKCLISKTEPTLTRQGWIRQGNPYITVACRPHGLRQEAEVPGWCPLNKQ